MGEQDDGRGGGREYGMDGEKSGGIADDCWGNHLELKIEVSRRDEMVRMTLNTTQDEKIIVCVHEYVCVCVCALVRPSG